MWNRSQGFTLIECVATLILLGLLAVVSVSVTSAFRYKAEQSTLMQTDVFIASSCIERAKTLSAYGEFEKFKDSFSCPKASVTVTGLKATPSEIATNTSGSVKIEPSSSDSETRFYLVTAKAGSVELNYVAR